MTDELIQGGGQAAGVALRFGQRADGRDRELAYALLGLTLVRLGEGETELASELLTAPPEVMAPVGEPFGRAVALYFYATAMAAAGGRRMPGGWRWRGWTPASGPETSSAGGT